MKKLVVRTKIRAGGAMNHSARKLVVRWSVKAGQKYAGNQNARKS